MKTKLKKWGNSLGLRIPKEFVLKYNLKVGKELDLNEQNQQLFLIKKSKLPTIEEIANSYPKQCKYEEILPGELSSEQW